MKIGVIGSFKTPAYDVSATVSAAKAAALALNAAGGIAGHKVVIDSCNDNFSATGAATCGRQMISDHVIAVTGASIFDAGFQPLLKTAGIPIVGQAADSINAYTGTNEYLLTPGQLFELYGATDYVTTLGVKSVYVSRQDVAVTAAITQVIQAASKAVGYSYAGEQKIPATATDFATYAAQFKSSGADSILLGYADATAVGVIKALSALGINDKKLIYTAGDVQPSDLSAIGAQGANMFLGSSLPPLSATQIPGVVAFNKEIAAEAATGDDFAATDKQSSVSLQSWLAVKAIAKVAPTTGSLTAATLTTALNSATNVDLMGLIPPWTPNKAGVAPLVRVNNADVYIDKVDNGQLVLAQPDQIDVSKVFGI